jgi:signal peptidase II
MAADQLLKYALLRFVGMGGFKTLIDGFLSIEVIQNNGIAFGMLSSSGAILICVTSFLIGALIVFILLKRKSERKAVLIPLAMIAGGALGNLVDRLRYGYVIDFIHFHIWPYIFNFADICVVLGCLALLIALIIPQRKRRRR